jgi:hypothetical protein
MAIPGSHLPAGEVAVKPVNYVESAKRHFRDARLLSVNGRNANAGQLFGFCVECGLKALLLACGVNADADGGIPGAVSARAAGTRHDKFRKHMPMLGDAIISMGTLIPDGPRSTHYMAGLPSLGELSNWNVEHRYYADEFIPVGSLPNWELAAKEVIAMLENAILDGVI